VSLPRGSCPHGGGLVLTTAVCRTCERSMVVDAVMAVAAGATHAVVAEVVAEVTEGPAALRSIRQALTGGPGALLVGAPPAVGRLVVALRERGVDLPEPLCARCGRRGIKLTTSSQGGVCGNCRRRQLASECVSCGLVKVTYGRDPSGGALCAVCAPRPKRTCSVCGRVRKIARRAHGDQGDLCDVCFKGPVATCRICHRERPCHFVSEGRPICVSCSPRRSAPCAHCGEARPPTVRWPEGPVCERCYRAALGHRGTCATCGEQRRLVDPPGPTARNCTDCSGLAHLLSCRACGAEERPYRHGLCVRCSLELGARELVIDIDGPLAPIYQAIVGNPQPFSACNWLRQSSAAKVLGEIAAGSLPLTHEALDAHPHYVGARLARHMLVANGVLAARDDAVVQLEAWVVARLDEVASPEHRRVLRSYATWRVLRRTRERAAASNRPTTPTAHAKTCLLAAIALCDFLDAQGVTLGECSQVDIDRWFDQGLPSEDRVGDFLDWVKERKLTAGLVVAPSLPRVGATMDEDTRWALVHRLLHDDTLETGDRVAGCLVLLYGQQVSRIATLARDQVSITDEHVRLEIGIASIDIPEPLAGLLVSLLEGKRPYNGVASPPDSPWLFPGLSAGRPVNASNLGARLRRIGVRTMPGRRSAMNHLAARLPAAFLADLLGLHHNTAVRWVRGTGADWSTYAAELVKAPIANHAE
jgi:hypothetical protein